MLGWCFQALPFLPPLVVVLFFVAVCFFDDLEGMDFFFEAGVGFLVCFDGVCPVFDLTGVL